MDTNRRMMALHDHVPESPRSRLALALTTVAVGAPFAVWGLIAVLSGAGPVLIVWTVLLLGGAMAAAGVRLGLGLAEQAAAAPRAANPAASPDTDDPVQRLRDRYAAGEVSDEEFERRMERLVETDPDSPSARSVASDGRSTESATGSDTHERATES